MEGGKKKNIQISSADGFQACRLLRFHAGLAAAAAAVAAGWGGEGLKILCLFVRL